MIIELQLFYLFSTLILLAAFMVISSKNPIHSIIYLIIVFCNATGLLIMLEVEFLAMVFLIVYVGAIAVLFLFVIMMLNIKVIELSENVLRYLPIGSLIGIVFLLEVFLIINNDLVPLYFQFDFLNYFKFIFWSTKIVYITNIEILGLLLYTYYFYLFILSSIILLISMIGAIVLTLYREITAKRQNIFMQISRNVQSSVHVI